MREKCPHLIACTIICFYLACPSPAKAERTLIIPPIEFLNSIDYTKDGDGEDLFVGAADDKAAWGRPTLAIARITIQLQNTSQTLQSGSFTLDGINATYGSSKVVTQPDGSISAVSITGQRNVALKADNCVYQTIGANSPENKMNDLTVKWTLPANTKEDKARTRITIEIIGAATYGPVQQSPAPRFKTANLQLIANPILTVDQDRGAILATYTSNYVARGFANLCGGIQIKGFPGEVKDRGGGNLTLLLNGGRPF